MCSAFVILLLLFKKSPDADQSRKKKKGGITLHRCRIWTEGKQNEMQVGRGVSAIEGENVGLILSDNFFSQNN